jgi:hypothetical protein
VIVKIRLLAASTKTTDQKDGIIPVRRCRLMHAYGMKYYIGT